MHTTWSIILPFDPQCLVNNTNYGAPHSAVPSYCYSLLSPNIHGMAVRFSELFYCAT